MLALAAAEPTAGNQPATTAPAAAAPAAQTEAEKAHAAEQNRLVCRSQNELGSKLKKTRVCRTVAEWAVVKDNDRRSLQRMQTGRKNPET
jgi:hypothetical protein